MPLSTVPRCQPLSTLPQLDHCEMRSHLSVDYLTACAVSSLSLSRYISLHLSLSLSLSLSPSLVFCLSAFPCLSLCLCLSRSHLQAIDPSHEKSVKRKEKAAEAMRKDQEQY
eukprot:SAG22_NODE_5901_length_934_cov_1.283832_2_plen_112_part_00